MRLTHALSILTLVAFAGCPKPNREPVTLTINPSEVKLARGQRLQLAATAVYPDGSSKEVTSEVSWSVDDSFVASFSPDEPGVVIAAQDGTTNIRARLSTKEVTRPIVVAGALLQALEVDPPHPVVPANLQLALIVTALTSDQQKVDVTGEAVWMSASPDIATVEGNQLVGHRAGTTTLTVSVQGTTLQVPVDVTNAQISSIDVQPSQFSLAVGFARAMSATALMDDGSSLDITSFATWSASNRFAIFSQIPGEEGIVSAAAPGTAQLFARVGTKSGSATITVTDATLSSLELSPVISALAVGTTQRFELTGVFSDGTTSPLNAQAMWASSNANVISISGHGVARALTRGSSTITASAGGQSIGRMISVTDARLVSLELSPQPVVVARGLTTDVKVFGTFADGSRHEVTGSALWSVGDPSKASVSNASTTAGRVTAIAEGQTDLTASLQGVSATTQLTVSAAALTMIQLSPATPMMPLGTRVQFTAMGVFSDGSTSDLTSQATWTSSDTSHVTVASQGTQKGEAFARGRGTATVTVSLGGKSASTIVTVNDASLVRIEVSPLPAMIPVGLTQRFTAQGVFTDGTITDLTTQGTWSIANTTFATVSNAPGTRGLVTAVAQGATRLAFAFNGTTAAIDLTVTAATITQLEVTPSGMSLPVGLTTNAHVIATWSDGLTLDVTSQCTFTTDAPGIAQVSNAPGTLGEVRARMPGQTRLTANAFGLSASTTVVVTPAVMMSITLMPNALSLAHGTFGRFTARATYSDGSDLDVSAQASWSSSAPTFAQVSNVAGHEGEVHALQPGSATIRAQLGTQSATALLTITPATLTSLELDPAQPTVPLGADLQFTLTGRYSDGSAQVHTVQAAWSSSNGAVATVSNAPGLEGHLTSRTRGATVITAAFGSRTATATVTVTDATIARVELAPSPASLAKFTRMQLTATGVWTDGTQQVLTTNCAWASQNATVASVSNAPGQKGRLDALAPGVADITANCSGVTGLLSVTVNDVTLSQLVITPANPGAAAGFSQQLQATGIFSDGSSQPMTDFVTWGTQDASKATVSNASGSEGLVSALAPGSVSLTANALGVTHTFTFVVSAAVLQSLEIAPVVGSVPKGLGLTLVARGHFSDGTTADLSEASVWSSSQPGIAAVSNVAGSRGNLSALAEGTVTVTATTGGFTATSTITVSPAQLTNLDVTPSNPSVAAGLSLGFTATGSFTDGSTRDLTTSVTWSVGDGLVASISNADGSRGVARGLRPGTTGITATLTGQTGSTTLQVSAAQLSSIALTPANPSIPRGLGAQLVAMGTFTDGSTQDLTEQATWLSSDSNTVSVSTMSGSKGQTSALQLGSAQVTATFGATQGTTTVTVTAAVLSSIALTPVNPSVPAGLSTMLVATGTFSDGTTQDVSASSSWSSSNTSVAWANPGGQVFGFVAGTSLISVSKSGITGSATFTVTAAVLQQLQVTPPNAMRPRGLSQQFTAMGVFSDSSTQDLTDSVTWSSSDQTRVTISNANGSHGLAATPNVGAVQITATMGSISNSTPFTVTAAQLTSISISPSGSSAPLGSSRQFFAVGHYTDGSAQNLTTSATWGSSDQSVATISNANGSKGLATTLRVGATSISAAFGGFNAQVNLVVIQSTLTRIDVTPANASTALGYTRQFIATGTYSDGTTQVISDTVTWASSDESVALISNASGSRGLLSTVASGSTVVTATFGSVSGSTPHAVSPAALVFISLSPGSVSVANGNSAQLTATGFFSDGSSQDLTTTITWSSADPLIAQVSNASGSEGRVTGISAGNTSISATQGTVSASLSVTVQ
ncbi:MAG: Ig-like domain-containing protein [Archangium sp.]